MLPSLFWVFSVPEDSTSSFLVALCLECSRPEDSASRFVVLTNHPRHAALSVLGVLGPGGLHKQHAAVLCLECSRPEDSASRFVVLTNHPRHAALSVLSVLGPRGLHKSLSGCSLS